MFCIASFIVFAFLGIFSAYYRKLAKEAWGCVVKRLTFRPCDINFGEEIKGKILAKFIISRPRLARFLSRWFDWLAFIFVVASVWSLIVVSNSALNLWVYDTCNPDTGVSCSLGGDACGVEKPTLSLSEAFEQGRKLEWISEPFKGFATTVSMIPDRLKNWEAKEFFPSSLSFYYSRDNGKEDAVEAIDPGCIYCKALFENIKEAGFEKTHNLTFLLYPIESPKSLSGYKFANSYLMVSTIEAVKRVPLKENARGIPGEWQLLETIFTGFDRDGLEWQYKFDEKFTGEEAKMALQSILRSLGYSDQEILKIQEFSDSEEVKKSLAEQKNIVENKMKTVKIPTIIFEGRRFQRVIEVDDLK